MDDGYMSLCKFVWVFQITMVALSDNTINRGVFFITQEDFDKYWVSPDYVAISLGVTTPKPPTTAVQNPWPTQTSVDTFKHGIKRDPYLFMLFKEGKQFDSWQCSTMALACAQDVAEILDPSHVPVTQDDKDLFKEKQKYMFAVFDHTLLTDTGKALVCKHENDFDAQKVYAKIVKFYLKSTRASLDSSNLLSYITSVCLGSGIWKGSTFSFILHWQDQVCLYEMQVPATDHFSDGHKHWCSKMLYTQ